MLIDSRAPILGDILKWCDRVTAGKKSVVSASAKKIILFQTSSQQYFLSLQLLLKDYGYEVHDHLDWHVLSELPTNDDGETLNPMVTPVRQSPGVCSGFSMQITVNRPTHTRYRTYQDSPVCLA